MGAEVCQNKWINYSNQFTWALNNLDITDAWTLRIDADEYIDEKLRNQIKSFVQEESNHNCAIFKRKIVFLGKEIIHGNFYPLLMLRLWKTGQGHIEQQWMDEHIEVANANPKILDGDLVDHNLNNLTWWTNKHNGYATREVYDIVSKSHNSNKNTGQAKIKRLIKTKIYNKLPQKIRPWLYFVYRYIIGRGFLDGTPGFYFCMLQAFWYRTLVDAKLYELGLDAESKNRTMHEELRQRGVM